MRLTGMLASNLRYTFRSFGKNPGFATIAVLSLALGIGANTAIFSLLDRVLLRSLPVRHPEQLALFTANGPRRGSVNTSYDDTFTFSYPMYLDFDFRDRVPELSGAIAWFPIDASLSMSGRTERVSANLVSGNFFEVLGTGMAIGRPIIPEDSRAMGANAVAVLSYGFWQQKFAGDSGILNREVSIDGRPLTVVGVAERGFDGVAMGEAPVAFVPITMKAQQMPDRSDINSRRNMWLSVMGRLKPGVSREGAEAALNVFWKPILEAMDRTEPIYAVRTMDEVVAASVKQPRLSLDLLAMFAGLAFALAAIGVYGVIAFAVSQRKHELGIRMALGARPWNIRRMVITERARLAFAGVALGLAGALYLTRYMAPLLFGVETRDPLTFAMVPILLIGVTLAASSIPAVRATRLDPIKTLRHQ